VLVDNGNPLVSLADIAEMAGVSRPAVSNWRRRYPDFPAPEQETGATSLFRLADLKRWTGKHGKRLEVPSAEQLVWSALNRTRGTALPEEATEAGLIAVGYLALASRLGTDLSRFKSVVLDDHPRALERYLETLTFEAGRFGLDDTFMRETRLPEWSGRGPLLAELVDLAQAFGMDEVFEALLAAESRGSRGKSEYATPSSIAALTMSLAAPIGGVVYDPACGMGTLLLSASQDSEIPITLIGQDVNFRACLIAQLRMFLHGLTAHIVNGDTLGGRPLDGVQADLVVADPPFGMRWRPEASHAYGWLPFGAPPASRADMAWLQSGICSLKPGGVAMFVLPYGSLWRGGSEGAIRRRLIESNCIQAIIALPPAMYPTTSIPVVLWVVCRPGEQRQDDILLVDASQLGYRSRNRTELTAADIGAIDDCFRAWQTNGEVSASRGVRATAVHIQTLIEGDSVLNPARWILDPDEEPSQLLKRAQSARANLEAASASFALAAFTIPSLKVASPEAINTRGTRTVGDLATLSRPRRIDTDFIGIGTTPLIRRRDLGPDLTVTPSERVDLALAPFTVELTRPGDVIAVADGPRLRAGVDQVGGAAVSPPLVILRPRTEMVDPIVLAAVINSISQGNSTGTSAEQVDLAELEIPYPSADTAAWLNKALRALGEQRRQASAAVDAVDELRTVLVLGLSSNVLKVNPETPNAEER
jgi:hypothetical protein